MNAHKKQAGEKKKHEILFHKIWAYKMAWTKQDLPHSVIMPFSIIFIDFIFMLNGRLCTQQKRCDINSTWPVIYGRCWIQFQLQYFLADEWIIPHGSIEYIVKYIFFCCFISFYLREHFTIWNFFPVCFCPSHRLWTIATVVVIVAVAVTTAVIVVLIIENMFTY